MWGAGGGLAGLNLAATGSHFIGHALNQRDEIGVVEAYRDSEGIAEGGAEGIGGQRLDPLHRRPTQRRTRTIQRVV